MPFNPVTLATPAFIFLVIVEMLFAWITGRGKFEARDTATSLTMGFLSVIAGALYAGVFIAFGELLRPWRIADIGWSWGAFIVAFILDDLAYYWWHRASHRVRWLWADHVQHHSSQHYNLSTALRQPVTGILAFPGFFVRAPLFLAGFPVPMLAFVHGLNLVYQFWIHTESIGKCPAGSRRCSTRPRITACITPPMRAISTATTRASSSSGTNGSALSWKKMRTSLRVTGLSETSPPSIPLKLHCTSGSASARISPARAACGNSGPPDRPARLVPDGSRDTSEIIRTRWAQYRDAQSPAE